MSKLVLSDSTGSTWLLVSALCGALIGAACQSSPSPSAETTTTSAVTSAVPTPEVTAAAATTTTAEATTTAAASAEPQKPSEATAQAGKKDVKPAETSPKPNADAKPTEPPKDTIPEAPKEPPAEPTPAIEKPCLAQSFNFPAVKKACEKGGVPKAKSLMKSWTNKAKEKGEEYKCATCHDNQRTYTNKSNADDDLRKLLAVIK